MNARRLARFLAKGLSLGLIGSGTVALAATPKVCGNDAALGSFDPVSCPTLRDDGVAPDEAAGDGIYTVEVMLSPKPVLEYKILPSGAFDGTQIGQSGTCDLAGTRNNTYGNIQIPDPDTSRPVRFFYDSRVIADSHYAAPPGNRSGGDDLMPRSPAASCPQWLAVGDFQNVPFDRAIGAVELTLQRPGVLVGRLTATKATAAGWRWKVVQGGTAAGFRKYGPSGWADDPCDADNVVVASPVRPGDIVYFTWYSAGGRLRTDVQAPDDDLDGGIHGGLPLCPPPVNPADLGAVADLAVSTADGGSGPTDLSAPGDADAARPLPGIHCNCELGRSVYRPGPRQPPERPLTLAAVIASVYLIGLRRRARAARNVAKTAAKTAARTKTAAQYRLGEAS